MLFSLPPRSLVRQLHPEPECLGELLDSLVAAPSLATVSDTDADEGRDQGGRGGRDRAERVDELACLGDVGEEDQMYRRIM